MATSYNIPFDKFLKKLVNDKEFFKYKNLTQDEISEFANDHMVSLLNQAIAEIYVVGKPDIDLYDKDDVLMRFNEDLVIQEINLLVDLMYFKYYEEGRNKLKEYGLTFKTSELNLFSPAEDRRSFLEMVQKLEDKIIPAIKNYLSRDRKTWNYKFVQHKS